MSIIIAMLILPATTILATPLTNTYFPPVFGQALLPEGTGVGAFGFGPVPSSSPFDLAGLGSQANGLAGDFPTNFCSPIGTSTGTTINFSTFRIICSGLTPASNGLDGFSRGCIP